MTIPSPLSMRENQPPYIRELDLPKLIKVWPKKDKDITLDERQAYILKLYQALRTQRRKRATKHWSYDMNRHLSLLKALKAERASLAQAKEKQLRQTTQSASPLI